MGAAALGGTASGKAGWARGRKAGKGARGFPGLGNGGKKKKEKRELFFGGPGGAGFGRRLKPGPGEKRDRGAPGVGKRTPLSPGGRAKEKGGMGPQKKGEKNFFLGFFLKPKFCFFLFFFCALKNSQNFLKKFFLGNIKTLNLFDFYFSFLSFLLNFIIFLKIFEDKFFKKDLGGQTPPKRNLREGGERSGWVLFGGSQCPFWRGFPFGPCKKRITFRSAQVGIFRPPR